MESSDLIGIGRLGGSDPDGFHRVLVKPRFRAFFEDVTSVFLIFNSHRVFYVTICERKVKDQKILVRFAEDGIEAERRLHKETIVAIDPVDMEEDETLDYLLGYKVIFAEQDLGEVRNYFHNNAQYVLEIEMPDGSELLVPFVDHYVQAVLEDPGVIALENVQDLIDLALTPTK
ncbi:MAG TPA: hypothetical protein DCQ12_04945 [Candidatus Cloacimonas sp.]|jgi:ribosomal 30S subunit maturation factor RimM|nr:hypothetical protein [Candidatus Cloacimonas sp.]